MSTETSGEPILWLAGFAEKLKSQANMKEISEGQILDSKTSDNNFK